MSADGVDRGYRELFEAVPISLWDEDYTELVGALDALRACVTDLAGYFADHPHVMSELARKIRIVDANRAAVVMCGARDKHELIGSIERILLPESFPVFRGHLLGIARGERQFSDETVMSTLQGERIWIHLTLSLLPPRAGVTRGVVSIVDITKLKHTQDQLERALSRSHEELAAIAHAASHDLQEPLRMVTSYAQMLHQRYRAQLDARADKYINYVVDGAKRIRQLILDLLALSNVRMEGKALERVDCNRVVDRVVEAMNEHLTDAGATIECDALPEVMADSAQMTLVFYNLFSNSIKFRSDDPPRIQVSARRSGGMWQVTVTDNGIGFDVDKYGERVFELFQRLLPRDRYPGTGIGLTIVRKIIDRHGGRIWTDSRVGHGSAFTFTLPAIQD